MLENEPNGGANGPDEETTEQLKVTRRRRSASRPAGPPPDVTDESAAAPVTQPAPAVTAESPVETAAAQAVGEAVAEAAEAVEEKPKRATRTRSTATTTRRRTTKKAAESDGEQPSAEPAALPASDTPETAHAVRPAGAPTEVDEPVQGSATRVVRRPAGAPVEVEEPVEAAVTRAAGAPSVVEEPVQSSATRVVRRPAGAPAEVEEPVEAAVTRAAGAPSVVDEPVQGAVTRAVRRPAGAPAEVEEPVEAAVTRAAGAPSVVDEPVQGTATRAVRRPAGAPAEEAAEEAAPKRRRTRKKAEPEAEAPVEAAGPVAEAEEDEILEGLPADEPLDDEPAGEDLDEEVDRPSLLSDPFGFTGRRDEQPGTAFQRPAAIFAPLFQAPDPTQAKPARPESPQPVAEPEDEPLDESVEDEDIEGESAEEQEDEGGGRRRRRRRGGRGRGKARERDEADESDESEDEGDEERGEEAQEEEASSSRRRRRRRRRGSDEGAEPSSDDPPNTVVRIRAPRSGRASALDTATDGVQSVRGSTRLEAKKQRRREGRELGRRRPPIITESEFLARRESVDRMMVVRRQGDRTQIAVLEDGVLVEHYVNREASQSYVGNVYLGKVQNVLPSMEAAFVDIGKGRNAVLYAGEVNFDTAGLEGQPKRIESALKSGQSVLVQVTKDPIGHKGARLTSQISLPGRYLVYVPDGSMTGISRKLPDKERTRLKSILKKVMPENAGVIVRTAAEGASEDELARDVARLSAQWENIQKKAKSASPPELLSAEPDLTIRVVRDVFNEDFTSLVVQGEEAWDTVDEYVKYVAPHLAERLSRWDGDQGDVFEQYRIDEQLGKAMERKVWLPSGGSLVIDRTEAMTVVDVNTGKFTGQGGNLEETVTRNNLEAAEEIVRQLRLRDIGGIIVIDFIDMVLESNRDLVLRRLLECLARDRTKHQVAEVTSLGLVQMTRKRVGQGLLEAFSTPCECCNGRGLIVHTEPVEAKPEPRGTQGKMAVEKAVSEKVSAAKDSSSRDTVTGALEDVPAEDDQAGQTSGRGRRRSRRARSAE
ncbi:Rne/Rng family ribonuclease [Nonomuraea sp. NPDC000554]|uniref:Rne/Rng family ribonuclease n=1 Tax=Nonomuraea sp. NPDC000554 TaxID=3154259 RepID=UPI0033201FCF